MQIQPMRDLQIPPTIREGFDKSAYVRPSDGKAGRVLNPDNGLNNENPANCPGYTNPHQPTSFTGLRI